MLLALSASSAKPVTLTLQSYDSTKTRTGGLQILVYPAAPNFYQRYAVDLSTCQPTGAGTFQPNAPYVSFSFSTQDASWQGVSSPEIRVDNVNYALPAYYVSTTGNDHNSGRTEALAFLTPQKAMTVAGAGDIIDVMSGTYISPNGPSTNPPASYGLSSVAYFVRAGTPAKWIVLKNYPGQTPTFESNAWNIIGIVAGSNGNLSSTILAYLEIRGLHIRGEGDVVATKYPDSVGQVDSRSNSNGIAIDGRYMTTLPHHIRIANNFIEYCPACGIGELEGDWIAVENNVCSNNSWTTIYGTSGISLLGASNFDATDNVYKQLVRNNVCYGNQTFYICQATNSYSDGNGIILDVNQKTSTHPTGSYIGRTLVQSNLSYNNGGSGIHSFEANRVDIINNTAYLNSASPHLQYGEIFVGYADDVRIMNNILVAPVANTAAGELPEPVNSASKSTNVVFSHNLYFGGNTAPVMGTGDAIADPRFVAPGIDPTTANFHLQTTSPALATGIVQPFSPFLDLDGRPRSLTTPDKGVYQLLTALSGTVSLQGWQGSPQQLVFTLTPTGTTAGSVVTQTLTPAANGTFTLSGVVPGSYTLGVKGALWLRQAQAVDTTSGSVGGLVFTLPSGDINNDNQVNGTDFLLLRAAYGTSSGSGSYNPAADLNGDGQVNGTDFLLLRQNYGTTGAH